jgi:hypothetical protein
MNLWTKFCNWLKMKDTGMVGCSTCNGAKEVDYDLGRPVWPNEPGTAPNQVIRVPCPDCVPCDQCAHPNHDGVHTCRLFHPTYEDWDDVEPRAKTAGKWRMAAHHFGLYTFDWCDNEACDDPTHFVDEDDKEAKIEAEEKSRIREEEKQERWCPMKGLVCSPPDDWNGDFPYVCTRCHKTIGGVGG